MKRSSQVALVLMGATAVGASSYAMAARTDCVTPGSGAAGHAVVAAQGPQPAEPCRESRRWSSSSSGSGSSVWSRSSWSRSSTSLRRIGPVGRPDQQQHHHGGTRRLRLDRARRLVRKLTSRARWLFFESPFRSTLLVEHDLVRQPASTFPDPALRRPTSAAERTDLWARPQTE